MLAPEFADIWTGSDCEAGPGVWVASRIAIRDGAGPGDAGQCGCGRANGAARRRVQYIRGVCDDDGRGWWVGAGGDVVAEGGGGNRWVIVGLGY